MPSNRAKRTLVRWKDENDKELLLWIVHVCAESGIRIPFDKVAWCMGENFTKGAVTQHLTKLRTKAHNESLHVPNAPKRRMNSKLARVSGLRGLTGTVPFKAGRSGRGEMVGPYGQFGILEDQHRVKQENEMGAKHGRWTNDPEDDYEEAQQRKRRMTNPFNPPSKVIKRDTVPVPQISSELKKEVDSEDEEQETEEVNDHTSTSHPAVFGGQSALSHHEPGGMTGTHGVAQNLHQAFQPIVATPFDNYEFSQQLSAGFDQSYHAPHNHGATFETFPYAPRNNLTSFDGSQSRVNSWDSGFSTVSQQPWTSSFTVAASPAGAFCNQSAMHQANLSLPNMLFGFSEPNKKDDSNADEMNATSFPSASISADSKSAFELMKNSNFDQDFDAMLHGEGFPAAFPDSITGA